MTTPRIMIVAHGHPDLSKGGAEVAAYHLFKELTDQGVDALFVARSDEPSHGGSAFSVHGSDREILLHVGMSDYFMFTAGDSTRLTRDFAVLLERYKPDVVHFHHYLHIGLEAIKVTRSTLPDARIILTLHEYLGICAHNGQMVKKNSLKLCHEAKPAACARCMPERTPEEFFLRERYFKAMFADVDVFISPSEFLAERYRAWGLPAEKLVVLENGIPEVAPLPPRPLAEGEVRGRFAYFGQINPYKGLDVLLEALTLLPEEVRAQVHLDVHGAMFYEQPAEFVEKIERLREELGDTVSWHGAYEKEELGRLMAETDWVVVPSVWWENSPLVIQEAFAHGRPVICSNIGGMAEKVRDGVDGILVERASSRDFAEAIAEAATDGALWEQLRSHARRPVSTVDDHLSLCVPEPEAAVESWPAGDMLVAVGATGGE